MCIFNLHIFSNFVIFSLVRSMLTHSPLRSSELLAAVTAQARSCGICHQSSGSGRHWLKYKPCTGPRNSQLPRKLPSSFPVFCVIISRCFENGSGLALCQSFLPSSYYSYLFFNSTYRFVLRIVVSGN